MGTETLRAAPALSQRTLLARGLAPQNKAGPPVPSAPVTTPCPLCNARTPVPQHEASKVQELGAWACLHHCKAASRRHHFSQIHLSPTSSLYPARYLRPGSCGMESMVTSS